jgi:oligopeptide/dipeptide ABC transporter ATP-binding protein
VPERPPLLEVVDVAVHFASSGFIRERRGPVVRAVDGVSIRLDEREVLGVVGESGSGKSTLGRAVVQVQPVTAGEVRLHGEPLTRMSPAELLRRRKAFQMVFQDPQGSLNPRHRAGRIVAEPLKIHGIGDDSSRRERVRELLTRVGLGEEAETRYPHELSGGQLQRLAIARALSAGPEFIVCDEPVSALDVSIQAQIVELLRSLREELGLSLIFIAHDLAVVRSIAERVAVMYLGVVVEIGPVARIFGAPHHPYTQALLAAVPIPDPVAERERPRTVLRGEIPSPTDPPSGCRFRTRCPFAQDRCATETPELRDMGDGQLVACHFAEDVVQSPIPGSVATDGTPVPSLDIHGPKR